MGSSIVMMWSLRVSLIWSIIAASVVDLPLPVGPVTRIRPRGSSASFVSTGGIDSSASVGMASLSRRSVAAARPCWKKTFTRLRVPSGATSAKSASIRSVRRASRCASSISPRIRERVSSALICTGGCISRPSTRNIRGSPSERWMSLAFICRASAVSSWICMGHTSFSRKRSRGGESAAVSTRSPYSS